MNFVQGLDMWSLPGIKIVTTNGVLTKNGLVMGAGAALQATKLHPDLPRTAKTQIEIYGNRQNEGDQAWTYWFLMVKLPTGHQVGLFQTKYHYKDNSDLSLIENATAELTAYANRFPNGKFVMNCPGIGLGKLTLEDVWPIICQLPDNVTVCVN